MSADDPFAYDGWCRAEDCRYRYWRSGPMPTHRVGDDCPAQPASPRRTEAEVKREGAVEALREFADAVRFPNYWILFRRDDGRGVTVGDLLRETAARIENGETP